MRELEVNNLSYFQDLTPAPPPVDIRIVSVIFHHPIPQQFPTQILWCQLVQTLPCEVSYHTPLPLSSCAHTNTGGLEQIK